jgi:uncharacterized membrane protein YdjX (TVP38/TMEM64 family)
MTRKKSTITSVEIFGLFLVGVLFLLVAYVSMTYHNHIEHYLGAYTYTGPLLYILITITATVIAPVSATPLIPIATSIWGPFLSALFSIIGWSIGAVIAFALARRFGYPVIKRFVSMRRIQQYAERIPKKNLFWGVLVLRLTLPVDILSYALGLFSTMPVTSYTIATVLGITPFAFLFAYTATLPLWLQAGVLFVIGTLLFVTYKYTYKDIQALQKVDENPRA